MKGWCAMGKPATIGQAYNLLSVFANNTDWGLLSSEAIQDIINNPVETGKHFANFLKNGARMPLIGDFKIATAPFDFSFDGKGWKTIPEEEDERSAKLTEVDFAKVKFVSCLHEGENSIKGEEKLRRLKEASDIRLSAPVFMGLWQDYQSKKENSVLERLYQAGAIKGHLDFFGTILLDPDGDRCVLRLYRRGDGRWSWNVCWFKNGWRVESLSAVLPQA
ncbi:MAG: hypothetical protein Q8N58_01365 [bacterium]|nr:hypothetical protein [bacterium]